MAQFYFVSQLPSLDYVSDNIPLNITEERFSELCFRFLGKKALDRINCLSLMPQRALDNTGSALIDGWNKGERFLRLALAKARAEKFKKSFDTENIMLPVDAVKAAEEAVETENPLEAEMFLNSYRLAFLETLRPMDNFSEDYVYYYGLRLKLLLRARAFDRKAGECAYKNIYNSILNGDNLEVEQ